MKSAKTSESNMFATVFPHHQSFSVEPLTYFVGDFRWQICPGQLVEIPYGKTEIFGIIAEVFDSREEMVSRSIFLGVDRTKTLDETFEIKKISKICTEIPLLSAYQIPMIARLAMKYILPIHKALKIFLSDNTLKRLIKYNFPLILPKNKNSWNFSADIFIHDDKIWKNLPKNKNSENVREKNNFFEKNFWKFVPKNEIFISRDEVVSPAKLLPFFEKWTVVVLPDDIELAKFEKFFENLDFDGLGFTQNDIAFFPSETTETRRAQAFIDIFNKKNEIIIWTRRLLQYNLWAYDEIWYLEDSFSSEYYHHPTRLRYVDFLSHIENSGQFGVKIFTSVPKLSTLSQFHFFELHHF